MLQTGIEGFTVRAATLEDTALIIQYIKELAEYEKMAEQVTATAELIERTIFIEQHAFVLLAEFNGAPVGYALWFYNFSTFKGRPGLYIEDIYIRSKMRGRGFGNALFKILARIAMSKDCARMEWICLDWNEPSRQFYQALGAETVDGWTVHRLGEDGISKLAKD